LEFLVKELTKSLSFFSNELELSDLNLELRVLLTELGNNVIFFDELFLVDGNFLREEINLLSEMDQFLF
jgi:hypothetical protein